ncbi:hypothetical protein Tco_0237164 [Tanacetum coccineum]
MIIVNLIMTSMDPKNKGCYSLPRYSELVPQGLRRRQLDDGAVFMTDVSVFFLELISRVPIETGPLLEFPEQWTVGMRLPLQHLTHGHDLYSSSDKLKLVIEVKSSNGTAYGSSAIIATFSSGIHGMYC